MNTGRLLWANLRARPLMTWLTALLVALGMATVVIVTLLARQVDARLTRDAAGIDLVVGAKGSPLQLVLSGVYHLDVPPGNIPLAALASLRANRLVARAIPLSLGDSVRGFRLVGTEREFLDLHGARPVRGVEMTAPMEAVIGARVAQDTGLDVGARFSGSHGLAGDGPAHADKAYTVVGVLAATGGVIDRLVVTPLESVWQTHQHAPAQGARTGAHEAPQQVSHQAGRVHESHDAHQADEAPGQEPDDDREITMVLLRYATPLAAASLPRTLNASDRLQAASPAFESARLFSLLGIGVDGMKAFGLLLLGVAALSVFVALFQALSDRRRDMALMRLLGASPARLFALLLAEGVAVTAIGVLLGLALGHGAIELAGRLLSTRGEWPLTGRDFDTMEWVFGLGALGLGVLASLIPAWMAARTPIAGVLADD